MFGKHVLEAMLARLRSKSNAGMFWHVSLWPNVGRGLVHVWQNVLEAMLACFGMFRFGPTLQEALRMIE